MHDRDRARERVRMSRMLQPHHLDRQWQGIPGVERTADGSTWLTFYSGGSDEGADNFVLLLKKRDHQKWEDAECVLVIDPPGGVRAFDPCLWTDPDGRLWLFWAQSYGWYDGRAGVWAARLDGPTAKWRGPRRIADGVMMNKPTVISSGDWLLPVGVWANRRSEFGFSDSPRLSLVLASRDSGEHFEIRGGADIENRYFDEHMIIERGDGSLDLYARLRDGIGRARSLDYGSTWFTEAPLAFRGPNSRFYIRRLDSGRILLINHYRFTGRNNLTALLSDDDGNTWPWWLVLDDRSDVSYPDAAQDGGGRVTVCYDRRRYDEGEILVNHFTEQEVIERSGQNMLRWRSPEIVSSLEVVSTPALGGTRSAATRVAR